MNNIKQVIELPYFMGFYNSWFEDYWDSRDTIGEEYTDSVNQILEEQGINAKLTYKYISSPAYYNYSTDKVVADIVVDLDALVDFAKKHLEDFNIFLNDNYSSHSGFISFMPDNSKEFFDKLDSEDSRYTEVLIQFVVWKFYGKGNDTMADINEAVYNNMQCLPDRGSQTWIDMGLDEE